MTTLTEYSVMAVASYISTRPEPNFVTAPPGWDQLLDSHKADPTSGFEAVSFKRVTGGITEIVISFAGTYPKDVTGDIAADIALGAGSMSAQLKQAVDYYLKVRAANGGAAITLTGHSLGGGLAALVGVFFGVEAHTFDQAPFAQSARAFDNPINVAVSLRQYLAGESLVGDEATVRNQMLTGLDDFITRRAAGGIPNTQYVTNINVKGEFLSGIPWNILDRVGRTAENIDLGASGLAGDQLHDMGLLAAVKLNDGFRQAALKLPDFLKLLFDSTLYWKETDTSDANLLYQLIRHQTGVRDPVTNAVTLPADAMLDRFTADLLKVSGAGFASGGNLTDALIAFAMQAYYEGPNAALADKQLFTAMGGGIEFLRSDVAPTLDKMKGYDLYLQTYLAGLDTHEWNLIQPKLADLVDWYLAGRNLDATATDKAAFMLGAGLSDTLTGGTQNDVLVGGKGNDQLSGDNTWLDPQYHGNDDLDGGADDNRLAIYSVRHIAPAWPAEYPAGIPDPRSRGPSTSRIEREPVAANAAAAGIAMRRGRMRSTQRSLVSKVGHGGMSMNRIWRVVA